MEPETSLTTASLPGPLPARMLNEFAYCPRLAYLEWVQGEWADSADTVEGQFHHRRVNRKAKGALRFVRGIWDDNELPATDRGGGVTAPAVKLSLKPMKLGLCEHELFTGQPSSIKRVIRWRDTLGSFRLAKLEGILRAADWRAGAAAVKRQAEPAGGQKEWIP